MEEKIYNHDSYGQIRFNRITGSADDLYGSSIQHENYIRLEISMSELVRNLHTDWHHEKGKLICVDMSSTQFAELMMNTGNLGSGIPCTIRYIKGKGRIKAPINKGKIDEFEEEFKNDMENLSKDINKTIEDCSEILSKKNINKKDKSSIIDMMNKIQQDLISNIPFMYNCFNEQMDKTITEAKGEVEAFVENKIRSVGLKHIGQEMIDNTTTFKIEDNNDQD